MIFQFVALLCACRTVARVVRKGGVRSQISIGRIFFRLIGIATVTVSYIANTLSGRDPEVYDGGCSLYKKATVRFSGTKRKIIYAVAE